VGGSCKPRMEKDSFQLQAFHPLCLPCVTTWHQQVTVSDEPLMSWESG
jgi:hypothetical protein